MAERPGVPMVTKTYPLDGGYQQDVSEFAIDTPGMVQTVNTRFTKLGEVEKSEPVEPTAAPPTSILSALGVRDDRVFVIDQDGSAYEYQSDDTWDGPYTGSLRPHTNTPLLDSVPAPAIAATCWARGTDDFNYTPGRDYIMTAWEVRSVGINSALPAVDVRVEVRWEDNGQLITSSTYSAKCSPQIADCGTGPIVFFCDYGTGDIEKVAFVEGGQSLESATSIGIANGPIHADHGLWADHDAVTASVYRDDARIGHCKDGGRGASFRVAGDPDNNQGAVAFTSTFDSVYFSKLTTSGTTTSTEVSPGAGSRHILDVDISGNDALVLYAGVSHVAAYDIDSTLYAGFVDVTGATATNGITTLRASDNGNYVNGSVLISGSVTYFATTEFNGTIDMALPVSATEVCIVRHGSLSTNGALIAIDLIQNHRLASNIIRANSQVNFVIEQCLITEPTSTSNGVQTCPAHYKGLTGVLVGVGATSNQNYKVLSAYDSAQSRSVNGSSQEQSLHLNVLTYENSKFYYGNRVLQQPEDLYLQQNGRDTIYGKAKGVYTYGEWQLRIYETVSSYDYKTIKYGKASIVNSSIAAWYAGDVLAELSPLEQPEIVRYANAVSGNPDFFGYELPPGATANDTRTCNIVVGYADRNGQLHRSPPSLTIFAEGNVAAADDVSNLWRDVTISTPVSALRDARDYFVEIYVGQGAEEPQLAHTESFAVNDLSTILTFRFQDSHSSPTNIDPVRASELLYTTGNVLAADAWPEFEDFTITSNRLWAVSRNIPSNVYYSKLFEDNIAPEFSASLIVPLGRNRVCTAIGSLDDKVIVFTEDEVFAIYGTGPDNTGGQGDFIVDKLQTRYGCTDPNSLVEYEAGLCWYSSVSKEFHAINSDLQITDIGGPVQDFSESISQVYAAVVYPGENEIRWLTSMNTPAENGPSPVNSLRPPRPKYETPAAGTCLAFNYSDNKWSLLENQAGNFATLYRGKPFYARIQNICERVTSDWWYSELMKVETPWIRVGNMQTLGRIEEIAFLGRYLSSWTTGSGGFVEAGDIQVTLKYDYEEYGADTDVFLFRANAGDLGTESGDRMQFSVHPGRPKCQAVKVLIEEVQTQRLDDLEEPVYSTGRGFTLSGMDIIYGTKAGLGTRTTAERKSK